MWNASGTLTSDRTSSTRTGRIGNVRCGRFSVLTHLGKMTTIGYLGEDLEVPITSMFDVYKYRVESLVITVVVQTQVWAQLFGDLQLANGRILPDESKCGESIHFVSSRCGQRLRRTSLRRQRSWPRRSRTYWKSVAPSFALLISA